MPKLKHSSEPRGRAYMWETMKRLSAAGGFTIADVHGETRGTSLVTIKGYLAFLRKAGAIRAIGTRPTIKNREAVRYRVTTHAAPEQRATGSEFGLRYQQLWTALRAIKGSTTARDLALTASTDEVSVKESSARNYLLQLARHGLVHADQHAKPFRYRLLPLGNVGPKAPVVTREGLFDPNNGEIVNLNAARRAA